MVDPRRDVAEYVTLARKHKLTIKYSIETHRQEDFFMGSAEPRTPAGRSRSAVQRAGRADVARGSARRMPRSHRTHHRPAAAGQLRCPRSRRGRDVSPRLPRSMHARSPLPPFGPRPRRYRRGGCGAPVRRRHRPRSRARAGDRPERHAEPSGGLRAYLHDRAKESRSGIVRTWRDTALICIKGWRPASSHARSASAIRALSCCGDRCSVAGDSAVP